MCTRTLTAHVDGRPHHSWHTERRSAGVEVSPPAARDSRHRGCKHKRPSLARHLKRPGEGETPPPGFLHGGRTAAAFVRGLQVFGLYFRSCFQTLDISIACLSRDHATYVILCHGGCAAISFHHDSSFYTFAGSDPCRVCVWQASDHMGSKACSEIDSALLCSGAGDAGEGGDPLQHPDGHQRQATQPSAAAAQQPLAAPAQALGSEPQPRRCGKRWSAAR